MAESTDIGWTDASFNPWWGCERVSPACAHCYADTASKRFGFPDLWSAAGERRFLSAKYWNDPLRWNAKAVATGQRRLVFCASMADVFEDHPAVVGERERLWGLIAATPALTWQLLTKRPENIPGMIPAAWRGGVPDNVWLGTSVENSRFTWRARELVAVPAPVHFLSCEPLLGSLFESRGKRVPLDLSDIEWVIGGGESGPSFRSTEVEWVRELRDASRAAGLPFFWKQNPGLRPKANGKELDGREWCEIPGEQLSEAA